MSVRDIIRRNDEGVVLRYPDPAAKRAHHEQREVQPNDLERIAILRAERALIVLEVIMECIDLGEAALSRVDEALQDVYDGLQIKRRRYGMYTEAGS